MDKERGIKITNKDDVKLVKRIVNHQVCEHPGLIKFKGMTPVRCWKCGKEIHQ